VRERLLVRAAYTTIVVEKNPHLEIPMGTQTRMSVQKRERERKKAEKAAMKRERRQQRKDIDSQSMVVEAVEPPDIFATALPGPMAPESTNPEQTKTL